MIFIFLFLNIKGYQRDNPGSAVVEIPPFHAGSADLIPDWGTKILHEGQCGKKKKKNLQGYQKRNLNKLAKM